MPYRRTYRKRPYRRRNYKRKTRRTMPRSIKTSWSPVQYVDITYSGNSISTTPTVTSLLAYVTNQIDDQYLSWTRRTQGATTDEYFTKILMLGFHYQFRYLSGDSNNTLRTFCYNSNTDMVSTATPESIFSGSDVDQAPDTRTVSKVHMDRIINLVEGESGGIANTSTRSIKGYKKVGKVFKVTHDQSLTRNYSEEADVIISHQSDSTAPDHPELFGYIRVYFRNSA